VKRDTAAKVTAVVATAAGIAAIVTRPFLFDPIGVIFLLITVKLTADRRLTGTVAAIVALGGLAGASIAVGFSKSLY
jgi:hypothetical protein